MNIHIHLDIYIEEKFVDRYYRNQMRIALEENNDYIEAYGLIKEK